MIRPTKFAAGAHAGFQLPFEGLSLLRRERALWLPALAPFLLSLAALAAGVSLLAVHAGAIYALLSGWLPAVEVSRWYQWLWLGPLWLVLETFAGVLFLAVIGVCLVASYLVASVLAAPFHDWLARRVEAVVTGSVDDRSQPGAWGVIRDAARALVEELRRLAFLLGVMAPLAAAGWLVPGAVLLTGPAMLLVTLFFLPLDYASYTLDRRRLDFRAKRRWLMRHRPTVLGFGSAAFLTCVVPGLNLLAMPVLVVGVTLLALRHPAGGDVDHKSINVPPRDPGGGAGRATWP